MATHILGVSALYHDSAAALIRDGEVVGACQEERFSRVRNDSSLPVQAATWCRSEAGIAADQIDWLVFYEKPIHNFRRALGASIATFPRGWRAFPGAMHRWLTDKLWTREQLSRAFKVSPQKILFCEHHLSHAASAFYCSPHQDAAVLVADAVGDAATTSLWRGTGASLELLSEIRFPHSLGLFYSAIAAYLGFAINDGEPEVMAMAAFGSPRFHDVMRGLLKLDDGGGFSLDLRPFAFHWHPRESYNSSLEALLGPARDPASRFDPSDANCRRYADVAASAQAALEEAMLHLARHAHRTSGCEALCLAGSVALNCVSNARLAEDGPFRDIWIQPAAGDAGGALGAALWAWHAVLGGNRTKPELSRNDLGRRFSRQAVREMLLDLGAKFVDLDGDIDCVAEELANGKVVGWFEGRDEWGARALGHRSILADPTDPNMQRRLNDCVKFREPYKPFAPAVTEAQSDQFFDIPAAAKQPARAMLVTARARCPDAVPAVVHVDGTARVQVVRQREHPAFHNLIDSFRRKTGTPVLLNTSFNTKGDPIVSTPMDALATFHRAGLDCLYVEGFKVDRKQ